MKNLCLFFILLISATSFGQEYSFTHYNAENGLPSTTVFDIFQSSKGYLWFGTQNSGVCRFDGLNYEIFNTDNGLSGNTVRSIFEDNQGRLWFATEKGITIYDGSEFSYISKEDGLTSDVIVALFYDSKGNVWAGAAGNDGGLNRISNISDSIVIKNFLNGAEGTKKPVFTIIEDSIGTIWAGTFGEGLYYNIIKSDTIIFESYPTVNFTSNYILSSAISDSGKLYFGTYDRGVFIIDPNKEPKLSASSIIPSLYESNIKRIWDILIEDDHVFLGSNEHGLIKIAENKILRIDEKNGLPGNQVLKTFRDNGNNLWVSIYVKGVSRFNTENINRLIVKNNDLNYNVLALKKYGSALWLGTNKNGLIWYNLLNNDIIEFNSSNSWISDHIKAIDIDVTGNLWLASNNGIYKLWDDKLINITKVDGLINNEVNALLVDSYNNIWCGTKDGISKITGDEISNSHKGKGLINNEIICLFEDKESNVWAGTSSGLAMFSKESGKLYNFDEEEGLLEKSIQCIEQNKDGELLIGTLGGGIYKGILSDETYKFSYYQPSNLLTSRNINFIKSDSNFIIVGTDRNVTRLHIEDSKLIGVKHYGKFTGFEGVGVNMNAVALSSDTLIVGASNGAFLFDNLFAKESDYPIRIQMSDVKLFYEQVDWQNRGFDLTPWTRAPKDLELPYKDKNLTFEFNAIQFHNPEALEYSCRLKELNDIWPPYSKDNYINYSDIRPGNYTLQIKARYNSFESEIYEYNFRIKPPFWNTLIFRLSMIVLVLLLFWYIVKQRERNLQKEKIRLDNLVKARTKEVVKQKEEIEEKNVSLQIANAEISNQNEVIEENSRQIIDSIYYAKNIQTALLPKDKCLNNFVKDYFILFKPRDIVSGDFYWYSCQDDKMIFVAADCTGHGVPGAFMSMLGISFLNEIVNEKKIFDPGTILNKLRDHVVSALNQHGELGEASDGMDLALLVFDSKKKTCEYAGAHNDLFIVRDGKLNAVKADRMPVAFYPIMNKFTTKEICVSPGDELFIFSDGYIDQIGGPDNKRLMKSRFKKILAELYGKDAKDQHEFLDDYFEEWSMLEDQLDDVLVVGLKI